MAAAEKTSRLVFWLRIVAIAYALFLMLFSFDVFEIEAPFLEQVGAFILHSVPSIALLIAIAMTWRRPQIMGIALLIFGTSLTLMFATYRMLMAFATISLVPLLTGIGLVWAGRSVETKRKN